MGTEPEATPASDARPEEAAELINGLGGAVADFSARYGHPPTVRATLRDGTVFYVESTKAGPLPSFIGLTVFDEIETVEREVSGLIRSRYELDLVKDPEGRLRCKRVVHVRVVDVARLELLVDAPARLRRRPEWWRHLSGGVSVLGASVRFQPPPS